MQKIIQNLVLLKGLQRFVDHTGRPRIYHRKTGRPLKAEFGSAEFLREYADAELAARLKATAVKEREHAGS